MRFKGFNPSLKKISKVKTGKLTVQNLVKIYGTVRAVDDISFSIQSGICFGLLGPNGAGKTTTIEMIEGITAPTSGNILYNGAPRNRDFWEQIGVQFQSTELLAFLTVRESIETFKHLYRNQVNLDQLIRLCSLEDIQHRENRKISGGQKQRLMLAIALANDPDLIFLDEPTTGLDPQSRRHLWDIVNDIKKRGKTIVLTTHYMDEAQILCDEIIIVDQGKIIAQGPPDELITQQCVGQIIRLPYDHFSKKVRQLFDSDQRFTWCMDSTNKHVLIQTQTINDCIEILLQHQTDLSRLTIRPHNLEDLFLQLTGKALRK
ncbi:MAG: antibiotic transport system ATP-binding protein [Candidatus Magnetoglobus multicellularis str. Araruama]|uniref:Antibiotic transport system ATP-binding protein n=1 Tax=Candidatus Magnetoglobus multicellularis str. Araruama TaxID=890399 RepID=A0A1V1PDY6_9BACT|nr:MAG: antibiotic transport system ATP-binding protein [Candidatus Magnetoglobus multicellularis str. Araruama]